MKKINSLNEAKNYLDRLALKNKNEVENEEYIPLEDFFAPHEELLSEKNTYNFDLRCFTYNEYMDKKISFDMMLQELKKYGAKIK